MKRRECHQVLNRIHNNLKTAFTRIEEFAAENKYGIEHTVLREQINGQLTLVETLKNVNPFCPIDFQTISQLIGEKRKTHSWIGWL